MFADRRLSELEEAFLTEQRMRVRLQQELEEIIASLRARISALEARPFFSPPLAPMPTPLVPGWPIAPGPHTGVPPHIGPYTTITCSTSSGTPSLCKHP